MAARSTRQEARARILSAFAAQLDRVIPEDESVPLKGATFVDFEDQPGRAGHGPALTIWVEMNVIAVRSRRGRQVNHLPYATLWHGSGWEEDAICR